MRRLEVDVAAAEEDPVVAVVVLVLAERPHPRPLAAAQLAAPHVRRQGGIIAAWAHRHLELDLAHALEGLYRVTMVVMHLCWVDLDLGCSPLLLGSR